MATEDVRYLIFMEHLSLKSISASRISERVPPRPSPGTGRHTMRLAQRSPEGHQLVVHMGKFLLRHHQECLAQFEPYPGMTRTDRQGVLARFDLGVLEYFGPAEELAQACSRLSGRQALRERAPDRASVPSAVAHATDQVHVSLQYLQDPAKDPGTSLSLTTMLNILDLGA